MKRADASSLSHHREQVERSADYLGTTLDRKTNASFFLDASINDLLRENTLEKPKEHRGPFQKALKGRHDKNRSLEALLTSSESEPKEKNAQRLHNFKHLVLRILRETDSLNFFNQHLEAFCEALDVLFLCVQEGKIKPDKESKNTETQISSFLERARFAIEGGTALFTNGLLKKSNQRKVNFVLAVVDDRGVAQFVDTEIKKEEKGCERKEAKKRVLNRFRNDESRFNAHVKQEKVHSLFNSQDLWGLDRTRMAVQKQGFPFLLVVTNEYIDEDWDAFGSIGGYFGAEEEIDEDKDEQELLEISFPKGTHETTKNNCNKIVLHMRNHPSAKYTATDIESEESLKLKNAAGHLKKLFDLKVLQREKNGRSYQYFLSEDYKVPAKSENFSSSETGSSLPSMTSTANKVKLQIKKEPISIKATFKDTPFLSLASLDSHVSQKITFHGTPNAAQGLFAEYLTCPTIGDGDCFFHAVFTEPGDAPEAISYRASNLREHFWNLIQTDDNYAQCFRPLLYEYYRDLWGNYGSENIPSSIRTLFQEDNEYAAARNLLIGLGVNPLPPQIFSPQRYSVDHITNQISSDNIRTYMKRFKVVGGPQTYIPVRNEGFCPAEALALHGGKRVNIFTYNRDTLQLQLYKPATAPEAITNIDISNYPIINVLHVGDHYVRLFNPSESGLHQRQSQQIMQNFEH